MGVIVQGPGISDADQAYINAAKAAVPDATDLVSQDDLGTAAAADVGDFDAAGSASTVQTNLTNHINDTTAAHDDSAIGAAASATNYTPAAASVQGHLSGIDTALGSAGGGGDFMADGSVPMTGVLNLSPGIDDTANLIKIPVTNATNGDVNFNMAISDFNGVKDVVFNWGFNQTIGGAKEDTGLHNWYLQLENNYNFSGSDWVEYHLNLSPVSGAAMRPFQYQYKKDGSQGMTVFKTTTYDVQNLAGTIAGFTTTFGATAALSRTDFFVPTSVRDARQFTMFGGVVSLQNAAATKTMGISNDADFFYVNFTSGASGGLYFQNWTYINFADVIDIRPATWIQLSKSLWFNEGAHIVSNGTNGLKIGTGVNEKIGFWNKTPVVQQVLATGAGATVDNVITLLQTLGLCKQS